MAKSSTGKSGSTRKTTTTKSASSEVRARRAPARRRTDKQVTEPIDLAADMSQPAAIAHQPGAAFEPTFEAIQTRAFELYCQRGGSHGGDVDDWQEAERQLRAEFKN
jgi:hypothetical protein